MNKKLIVSLALLAGIAYCQDDAYTEPKDKVTGTAEEEADYTNGAYEGLPEIMKAGQVFDGFDFGDTHSKTEWLRPDGNGFDLVLSSDNAARLDMLGDNPFQVTLPAVSPGNSDVTIEFDVATPGGYADAGYQVARAFVDDLDGDGEDDTIAYAAIFVPAVNADSANVLGGLLLGSNISIFGDGTVAYLGGLASQSAAAGAIGAHLAGKPALVLARKVVLSSQAESDSGSRTDSGFSAQVIPIGIQAAAGVAQLRADAGTDANTAGSAATVSLEHIACVGNGGTATNNVADNLGIGQYLDCNCAGAASASTCMTRVGQASGIADALTVESAETTTNGFLTGMNGADELANDAAGEDAIMHHASVSFEYAGGGLGRIEFRVYDEDGAMIGRASSEDVHEFEVAAVTTTDLPSQTAQKEACGQESTTVDIMVDPALFANYNVFGNTDSVCASGAEVGVHLQTGALDGTTIYEILAQAQLTGYAITLGNVVAAALDPNLDSSEAAEKFGEVIAENGLKSVKVTNVTVKAYGNED